MHDDLGAKLLQLLHRSSDTTKPLVREAINDLRDLLKEMEGESLSLEAATLQWQEETLHRCKDHGAELVWQVRTAGVLGASEFSELTRMLGCCDQCPQAPLHRFVYHRGSTRRCFDTADRE